MKYIILMLFLIFPSLTFANIGIEDLNEWCVSQMTKWDVIGIKTSEETSEEGKIRYLEIAKAAYYVAFDPNEKPLFTGPDARSKTLALLLVTAEQESKFSKKVDLGIKRGDNGKSWCLMQIRLSRLNKIKLSTKVRIILDGSNWSYAYDYNTGWGGEDLVQDRTKCFRVGLNMLRTSMKMCSSYPLKDRLSGYVSGRCDSNIGRKISRFRMLTFNRMISKNPPIADDDTISTILSKDRKYRRKIRYSFAEVTN